MSDTDVLDIDALAPKDRDITFGGKKIAVKPPQTVTVIRLGMLAPKMLSADMLELKELEKLVDDLRTEVNRSIPELKGKPLSTEQLMALVDLLIDMGTPQDVKALKEKGVTVASSKKAR